MIRHPFMPSMTLTDGIISLADNCGAWWLVDAVVSHVITPPVKDEAITFWTFDRDKRGGFQLLASDGGKGDQHPVTLVRQQIEYSDFPQADLPARVWVQRCEDERGRSTYTMMLPEEY